MWDVSEEEPKVEKVLEGVIPKVVDTEYAFLTFQR